MGVSGPEAPPDWIRMDNPGQARICDIHLREEGRDWSTSDSILNSILWEKQPTTDRELALSIFQYVVDHIYQDAYRSRFDIFLLPRLFNCYGMGNCDAQARAMAALCEMAGLASNEFTIEPAHTMVEIFYDGGWRLFDPHGGVYYLLLDNKTVAGWADILTNPKLLFRSKPVGPSFESYPREQWVSTGNRHAWSHNKALIRPRGFGPGSLPTLRAGESLIFEREGGDVYMDNQTEYGIPYAPHAKVTLTTSLPTPGGNWELESTEANRHNYETEVRNATSGLVVSTATGTLALVGPATGGYSLDVSLPYPIVSATAAIRFRLKGDARVELAGERRVYPVHPAKMIAEWTGEGDHEEQVLLRPFLKEVTARFATYSYRLNLNLRAGQTGRVELQSIKLLTSAAVGYTSLPRLGTGDWLLSCDGPAGASLTVQYSPKTLEFPWGAPQLVSSTELEVSRGKKITLEWSGDLPRSCSDTIHNAYRLFRAPTFFEVQLSHDKRFRWLLLPILNLRQDPYSTSWTLEAERFPPGLDVYWRVRVHDQVNHHHSPWSPTGRFKVR